MRYWIQATFFLCITNSIHFWNFTAIPQTASWWALAFFAAIFVSHKAFESIFFIQSWVFAVFYLLPHFKKLPQVAAQFTAVPVNFRYRAHLCWIPLKSCLNFIPPRSSKSREVSRHGGHQAVWLAGQGPGEASPIRRPHRHGQEGDYQTRLHDKRDMRQRLPSPAGQLSHLPFVPDTILVKVGWFL